MNPVRIHEGRGHSPGAIHDRATFEILLNAFIKRNGQPATTDTLPYTYIYILRWRSKDNLHTTPKLIMPISCLLQSIQFPSPQNDAITSFFCNFVVCFLSSPAIKSFLELTDCCLVYPTCFAIRLCFLQSLNKGSTISFC